MPLEVAAQSLDRECFVQGIGADGAGDRPKCRFDFGQPFFRPAGEEFVALGAGDEGRQLGVDELAAAWPAQRSSRRVVSISSLWTRRIKLTAQDQSGSDQIELARQALGSGIDERFTELPRPVAPVGRLRLDVIQSTAPLLCSTGHRALPAHRFEFYSFAACSSTNGPGPRCEAGLWTGCTMA